MTDKNILQPLGTNRTQSSAELQVGSIGNMKQDRPVRCDLQVFQNNSDHRTIALSKETCLFLRRGQEFTISLKFQDLTLRQEDLSKFTLITTTGPNPSKLNRTKNTFNISSLGDRKTWSARVVDCIHGTWKVSITSPADAIIGYYSLLIKINSGIIEDLGEFMMLFNPWCEDDQVYLYNEAERREFVLSEDSIIYLGTESSAQPHPWHFGQFEEDIPDICLKFLNMSPRYQEEPEKHYLKRNDPIYITQEIGDMIGRWDERDRVNFMCENGRPSYALLSSVPILRLWFRDETQPAYGHHWVFAAVLCTVLRCLGIPTRVVTNYNSAYDTDQSLQKDIYYDKNGARIHRSRNDSLWHFHVWNECWMQRRDLWKEYSGWQVLDATAQLKYSGELYCSGPAPVRAIKEGQVELNYDTKLIFSKVYTDTVVLVRDSQGRFRKAYSKIRHVGDGISTKSVGSDAQDDITLNYKYPKGSKEEHEAVERAKQLMLKYHEDTDNNLMFLSPVILSITSKNEQLYGEDISLSVIVSNVSGEEKDLELVLGAQSVHDYGITWTQFWSEKFHFHLSSGEEISVSGRMNYSTYKKELLENNLMRITALMKEPKHDHGCYALADQDVTICKPSLVIQPKVAVQFQPITAMVALSNPLKETLNECLIRTSGKGLLHWREVYRCKDVLPGDKLLYPLTFIPTQVGDQRLYVQLHSDKLGVINGFQGLQVLSCDVQEWSTHHWEEFHKMTEDSSRDQSYDDALLSLGIRTLETVLFGQDVPITMKVSNHSQRKNNVSVFLYAQYLDDNGIGCPNFWNERSELSLQANQDNTVKAQIHRLEYAVSPSETNVIRLIALVKDVIGTHCVSKKLIILKPKVEIKMPKEALQYRLITVPVSITNPLEEKLEGCVITVSGQGLIHKERSYRCDTIDPNTTGHCTITFSPSQSGVRKLHVRFDCRQFRDVTSCHDVDVLQTDILPVK
ncbi:protein 4.2-like [Bufo gargarizans]|uniref:protein 4.2-like n=1 Tax=Bufo gargarizans TaxID=30331 RepID=UPI001CF2D8ED|nr:protein 4.2-like [Bufo gargarizans]